MAQVMVVETACKKQLADLLAYRTAIAASAYEGTEAACAVHKAYLHLFLPFWWEHVPERGHWQLEDNKTKKAVLALLNIPAPAPTQPRQPLRWSRFLCTMQRWMSMLCRNAATTHTTRR